MRGERQVGWVFMAAAQVGLWLYRHRAIWAHHVTSAGLALLFLWQDVRYVQLRLRDNWPVFWPGSDVRIYYRAADAWIQGIDPWSVSIGGVHFGAPPPSLLATLPFLALPEDWAVWATICLSVGAAVFVLRRSRLPVFWLIFPPLFHALWIGSHVVIVVALLVGGWTALPAFFRVYALLPAAILGRWRALAWTLALLALSAPFLPWPAYLDHGVSVIEAQNVGLSAWGDPVVLLAPVLVALVFLGRSRAAWLAVPALWPFTQMPYGVVALPAITPVLAAFMSFRDPWAVSAGLAFYALICGRRPQLPSILRRYRLRSTPVRVPQYDATSQ